MSKLNDKIILSKWSSAGNTFLILNGSSVLKKNRKKFTQKYCDSIRGLKADGCLFLDLMKIKTFYIWDFYNSDGSTAEMCGNAARAAHQYCRTFLKDKERTLQFKTLAGIVKTTNIENKISVEMPEVKILKNDKKYLLVNTGVPHIVMQVKELSKAQMDLKKIKKLRQLFYGGQKGFNVTLLEMNKGSKIKAVTFERGVESFTPSCGT
nr:diaminopimelate epimerase [Pseudobdellovibrionaceae bacterium]